MKSSRNYGKKITNRLWNDMCKCAIIYSFIHLKFNSLCVSLSQTMSVYDDLPNFHVNVKHFVPFFLYDNRPDSLREKKPKIIDSCRSCINSNKILSQINNFKSACNAIENDSHVLLSEIAFANGKSTSVLDEIKKKKEKVKRHCC